VPGGPIQSGAPWSVSGTLRDANGQAISARTLVFVLQGGATVYREAAASNYAGTATVAPALPPGVYAVTATFALPVSVGGQQLDLADSRYAGSFASGTVVILPGNAAPAARDDAATAAGTASVTVPVAANDTDVDGNLDPLSVTIAQPPVGGSAAVVAGGQIRYTAGAVFTGIDRLLYRVCDTGADRNAATPGDNLCATAVLYITVTPAVVLPNSPPAPGPIVATPANTVVSIGAAVSFQAGFTDPDSGDTHQALWDWGDGTTTPGSAAAGVAGPVVKAYTAPGTYSVVLTVTDSQGASGQAVFEYVVVFDPLAGFVTGAGWINSPAGALVSNAAAAGEAKFGVSARYKKGATVPTGNMQFRLGSFNFESQAYDWLVLAGGKATLQGWGAIGDAGRYGFMLSVLGENVVAARDPGRFRLRIWDINNGNALVYDNEAGRATTANPITPVLRGSIKIKRDGAMSAAASADTPVIVGTPPPGLLAQLLRGEPDFSYTLFLPQVER
jgi:PKD repeat protein